MLTSIASYQECGEFQQFWQVVISSCLYGLNHEIKKNLSENKQLEEILIWQLNTTSQLKFI